MAVGYCRWYVCKLYLLTQSYAVDMAILVSVYVTCRCFANGSMQCKQKLKRPLRIVLVMLRFL